MRIAAVSQQSSGFIVGAEVCPPDETAGQLLVNAICAGIAKHGFIPETVFVKSSVEVASVEPLGRALGFGVRRKKKLKSIEMLKKDMMERMV